MLFGVNALYRFAKTRGRRVAGDDPLPAFSAGWQSLIHLAQPPPLPFLQYRVPHIHGIAKKFDVMQDFDGKEEVSQKDDCKQAIAAEGST